MLSFLSAALWSWYAQPPTCVKTSLMPGVSLSEAMSVLIGVVYLSSFGPEEQAKAKAPAGRGRA